MPPELEAKIIFKKNVSKILRNITIYHKYVKQTHTLGSSGNFFFTTLPKLFWIDAEALSMISCDWSTTVTLWPVAAAT